MHSWQHAIAVVGPIVATYAIRYGPVVVTRLIRYAVPRVPAWKRKLPTWTLPLIAIAVGVAQAFAPWLAEADVLTTGLLGASAVGLVEAGQRVGRVTREAVRKRWGSRGSLPPADQLPASPT